MTCWVSGVVGSATVVGCGNTRPENTAGVDTKRKGAWGWNGLAGGNRVACGKVTKPVSPFVLPGTVATTIARLPPAPNWSPCMLAKYAPPTATDVSPSAADTSGSNRGASSSEG